MSTIEKIQEIWTDLTNIRLLANGGQKEVYRATSERFGDVALKVIKSSRGNPRAAREIEIMRSCVIPHIPKLHDCQYCSFDDSERVVLIEEFISGDTLREHLINYSCMNIDDVISLMYFLLSAVVELETRGIVHRDIKPENILVCPGDTGYRLLDFGIARDLNQVSLTATDGFGPNTPGYAPPEQFNNIKADVSSQTDLFAIGVVAYEAITGVNPYIRNGDTGLDIYMRTNTMPTPDLVLNEECNRTLFRFIRSLMAKQPHRRPPSAQIAYRWFEDILQKRNNMIQNIGGFTI